MTEFTISRIGPAFLVTFDSADKFNRLNLEMLRNLADEIAHLATTYTAPAGPHRLPIIFCGSVNFSAGADLNEIAALTGPAAFDFSRGGQRLTQMVDDFPSLTIAAITGYCFGGAIDLALACDVRIAAPNAVFGHRGAALGLLTGWGGTQRLPRLVGKARALQMFCAAEKLNAQQALEIGLVNALADDPVKAAMEWAAG